VTNGSVDAASLSTADDITYTVDVSPTADGAVTLQVPATSAQDAAGNDNTVSNTASVTYDTTAPTVDSITRADTDPTNATSVDFTVTFSENVTGVDTTDFMIDAIGIWVGGATGASITSVSGSTDTYTVTVDTGSGDGTLSIDLADDDTIIDGASNPLGGTGAGNGDYTTGEAYTIDKTAPTVSSITRADTDPTNATSVDFTVMFSENVTGVDTTDFAIDASGVTGASITLASGSADTYTVTVDTGSGDGTLSIDLADDDTIIDGASNPLGGTGAGNGDYTTGESYTIDKTAPTISNVLITNTTITSTTYVKDGDTVEVTATVSDANLGDGDTSYITADLGDLGEGATANPDSYTGGTATWTLIGVTCTPADGTVTVTVDADEQRTTPRRRLLSGHHLLL